MKFIKRGLAVLLAVLLAIPALTAAAQTDPGASGGQVQEETAGEGSGGKGAIEEGSTEGTEAGEAKTEEPETGEAGTEEPETGEAGTEEPGTEEPETGEAGTEEPGTEEPETGETGTEEPETEEPETGEAGTEEPETEETGTEEPETEEAAEEDKRTEPSEEILFNTGSCVYSVVGKEDFYEHELGDACFEDDGSYTINIPEENPFFPYEVQFTYDGSTTDRWFMTPEDSVEVGGHRFYVSAHFDGTALTQLRLRVAGDTIVVYPEKKEFTDGDGAAPQSLQPLEEKWLADVDLTSYTPAELTMISPQALFGGGELKDGDKVVWKSRFDDGDDYVVSPSDGVMDLSRSTYNGGNSWEIIAGDGDQLTAGNIRYFVRVETAESKGWLTPTVYVQDGEGKRDPVTVVQNDYYDHWQDERRLDVSVSADKIGDAEQAYISLHVDSSVFGSAQYDHFKIYEGNSASAQEAASGEEITDRICTADMTAADAGYLVSIYGQQWITMVTFDASDRVTGCLPFCLYLGASRNRVNVSGLYARSEETSVDAFRSYSYDDGCTDITFTLYKGYAADGEYRLPLYYYKEDGSPSPSEVTGAYIGMYPSLASAREAGAENIKDVLFKSIYAGGGYAADYSQGITFSIFVGEDGDGTQEAYHYRIKAVEGEDIKSGNTSLVFSGLNDRDGNNIPCYLVDSREDSYAEYSYLTILVGEEVDLTGLAPRFNAPSEGKVYVGNGSQEEISGKSVHDFSKGAVEYTVGAENESDSRNYWLQVIKPEEGTALYINSLQDSQSDTQEKDGAIHSTREVLLDGYHDEKHDILLINMGTQAIAGLGVELESDSVELDSYWTLSGDSALSGFDGVDKKQSGGELPNLAKIRLRAKDTSGNGTDISGRLTIRSGDSVLVVLDLTGTIGDPGIVTQDIPQAVKYVPYGTMIQNNNKYRRNKTSYSLSWGALPPGMEVKPNGEIYGVPTEAGEFTFTVRMENSLSSFGSSSRTYTLVVLENTDANVDAATDEGYDLSQRIQDLGPGIPGDQTLVSEGMHERFVALYLDGAELVRGTDYTSESGSTRITIRSQTLASRGAGTHTLGIEFREDEETLKRAAQNYTVGGSGNTGIEDGDGTGSGNGGSGGGSGSTGNAGSGGQAVPGNGGNGGAGNARPKNADTGKTDVAIPAGGSGSPADGGGTAISHTVEEGDTLWRIAEKYYGSGALWERIYRDNADKISDPDRIYAGQILTVNLTAEDAAAAAVGNNGSGGNATDGDPYYYTVEPGDTLWIIAKKFYGRGWQWRKIYRANDTITDPGRISVGQVILIPDA